MSLLDHLRAKEQARTRSTAVLAALVSAQVRCPEIISELAVARACEAESSDGLREAKRLTAELAQAIDAALALHPEPPA